MISKLIESFANEMQKEETQEYINNILEPYLYKYKYYLFLITFMLMVIFIFTIMNTVYIFKIFNKNI